MKKTIALILLAAMLCTVFTACGSKAADGSAPVEINVGLSIVPTNLNCLEDDTDGSLTIAWCIFDRLVNFDNSGAWQPNIATGWEKVADCTWEFTIDLENFKFQNGDPLTMEDIEYSILRLKDYPKSADNGNKVESVSSEGNVLTITFVDNNNASPTAVLFSAVIVDKSYIEENGDDAIYLKPVGTGPWKLKDFVPTTSCSVELWDGYTGNKPQIDVINFTNLPEQTTRYVALESGQIQLAVSMSQAEEDLAAQNDSLSVLKVPSTTGLYFLMVTDHPPFDNVNVRRAMMYALDVESIAELEHSIPLKSMIFSGNDQYYKESDLLPGFDLEKARELLEAEGYNEDNPLTFELVSTISRPAMELYQADLLKIGVQMSINVMEFAAYLPLEQSGDFDMAFMGQSARGNHPLTDLNRIDANYIPGRNITRYVNDEVQAMVERMYVTDDMDELLELDQKINDILATDIPALPVYLNVGRAIMNKNLTGVEMDATGRVFFRNAVYNP